MNMKLLLTTALLFFTITFVAAFINNFGLEILSAMITIIYVILIIDSTDNL